MAFEIILISLVLPVIGSEFGIFDLGTFTPRDPFAYGAVAAATLVGSLIGSLTLGRLSDARGRRFLFQASVLSYSVFTALTALSFNVPSLFVLRMLAGVGLGGLLVIDPAILSEYLPPQHRGRYMVLLDFFWPAGFLVAIAFWYVFVIQLGGAWRLLFVAAAFPAFIAFLFRRTIPESPFYLARQGRLQEASSVLRTVARTEVSSAELAAEPAIPRAPVSALFRGDLLRRAIVTIGVWIALNFSYYGLFLWLPPALAGFGIVNFGNPNTLALFLVFSALAQFPGYAASFLLVDRWGRKRTLALFLILGGLSGYVFVGRRVPLHLGTLPDAIPRDRVRPGGGSRQGDRGPGAARLRGPLCDDRGRAVAADERCGPHVRGRLDRRGLRSGDERRVVHLRASPMESL